MTFSPCHILRLPARRCRALWPDGTGCSRCAPDADNEASRCTGSRRVGTKSQDRASRRAGMSRMPKSQTGSPRNARPRSVIKALSPVGDRKSSTGSKGVHSASTSMVEPHEALKRRRKQRKQWLTQGRATGEAGEERDGPLGCE